MEKKTLMKFSITLISAILVIFILVKAKGEKPFEDLDASTIKTATVHLVPPDATIDVEDIDELTELLHEVVIYKEDDSHEWYSGQAVTYKLIFNDGSKKKIVAYNPFIIIDGVGYKCKYEPCEALNAFGNSLLSLVFNANQPEPIRTIEGDLKTYYQMSDGTWQVDGKTYKYRLAIAGRMPNAAVDSTFVYLSNLEDITFDQAWKAAGLSSNSSDYFDVEKAVLVEWLTE